ncbi:MAG: class I SAM-dependent methyltransferase [Acidobacteriota bacterium]
MNSDNLTMKEREFLFLKRTQYYLSKGYDRIRAAKFVANCAGEIGSPALDVGAGKGILSRALAEKGISVIAVDINKYDLEFAKYITAKEGLKSKIKFLSLDASSLPFKEKSFKTVAMMNVLHHLGLREGEKILSEMARVLSDDGTIIIAEFDKLGFEIVAEAHNEEGSTHETSGFTMKKASSFLKNHKIEPVLKLNSNFNDIMVFKKWFGNF